MSDDIGIGETPVMEIKHTDVYRDQGRLILMIDRRPYAIECGAAVELAFQICSLVESMERLPKY